MKRTSLSAMVRLVAAGLVSIGLAGCVSSAPPPQPLPTCPPGQLLTDQMQCITPLRKTKPAEVDNRPIPYDPTKVDRSPIKIN